jgi:hypothetical protein
MPSAGGRRACLAQHPPDTRLRRRPGRPAADPAEPYAATIEWDSVEGWADYFLDRFGPFVTARQMLGDRFAELRAEIVAAWEARNEAEDGRLILPQEYLLTVVHL